jgi:hypothetical protein
VDLPGGGGKIALHEGVILGTREESGGRVYMLKGPDGRLWPYPADPDDGLHSHYGQVS